MIHTSLTRFFVGESTVDDDDVAGAERDVGPVTARTVGLSEEAVFTVCSADRRPAFIDAVAQTGETTLGDLADLIATDEHDITTEQVSSDQRKCVYVALYQTHLETLEDHEVVDWDKDRGTVAPGPAFECAAAVIEAARAEVE